MRASTDYSRLTEYEFDFFPDARRFEVVTLAYHDFAVANASTAMLLEIGVPTLAAHTEALTRRVVDWAESRADIRLVTPPSTGRRSGVVAFAPADINDISVRLKKGRVTHSNREGMIRFAPHCYNTIEEIDRVIGLLDA